MNAIKKEVDLRSKEELTEITQQWQQDKLLVDGRLGRIYQRDLDREYGKFLKGKNLQMLFRHASYLYHGGVVENALLLYPNEPKLITEVYRGILENGYYNRSKEREKRVRAHFGKAVSRQTRPKRR